MTQSNPQALTAEETTTISLLPDAGPLEGGELLPADQGDETVKVTAQEIANLAPPTDLDYVPGTRTITSSTGEDVTLPLVSTTAAGLIPHTWLTGAEPAILPHIHGDIAGKLYFHVKNVSGTTLPIGTPVCVVGAVGDTTTVEVVAADASDPAKMPAAGVLDSTLTATGASSSGHAVVAGELTGAPTSGFALRANLFVAAGGGLAAAPPTNGIAQSVGSVSRSHATTGSVAVLIGTALARAAYTGAYGDLLNPPSIPAPANQTPAALGTAAIGTGTNYALQNHVHQMPSAGDVGADSVGTAASAVSAHAADPNAHGQYLRPTEVVAGTNVTVDTSTTPGSVIINSTATIFDPASPGAIGGTTPNTGRFTGVGLGGVPPRTGYAAVLGSGVLPRGQVVTVAGSTYSCDIRAATRFLLAAAVAGNITIDFTNVADLQVSGGFVDYAEFQVDFQYTSGVITISAGGFTTKWDGNTAAAPTAGEFEQLIVQITPAIPGTPFTTPTVKVAPMKGNT